MASWIQEHYKISTDKSELQIDKIADYLSRSYWANGRARETIERSIQNSLCFGLFFHDRQIGFARVVSDQATFAYLCDVFIVEEFQGNGLGKWLMSVVMNHPDLQGLRRWTLATRDAHGLYRQFGFTELKNAENWMEIFSP
jgi:GNAT superfamily N-acetyltransferase